MIAGQAIASNPVASDLSSPAADTDILEGGPPRFVAWRNPCGTGHVSVSNRPDGAKLRVYRINLQRTTGNYVIIATVDSDSYDDSGLDCETDYKYKVSFVDDSGSPILESQRSISKFARYASKSENNG